MNTVLFKGTFRFSLLGGIVALVLSLVPARAQNAGFLVNQYTLTFEQVDRNGDGVITREESRTVLTEETFEKIDDDSDGVISRKEGEVGFKKMRTGKMTQTGTIQTKKETPRVVVRTKDGKAITSENQGVVVETIFDYEGGSFAMPQEPDQPAQGGEHYQAGPPFLLKLFDLRF